MVVWQPFWNCWRYIIARVSEMHVAYHKYNQLWVLSSSERTKTNSHENEITPTHFFTSYLHHRGGRGEKQGNASVRFFGVFHVFVTILFLSIYLLCIVPQYGCLAAI
jgi:hypothetical protein